MMDPLSVTASIIAIIQLTGTLLQYLNDANDAPKECKVIEIEAANLYSLLIRLKSHLEQQDTSAPWYDAVKALNVQGGPFDQYQQALQLLISKIALEGFAQHAKRMLTWKFTKEETAKVLERIERLKSLVSIALELDHL
jgi:hypothetical protein